MGLYAIYCAVYSARYPHRPYFSSVLRAEEPRPDCVACVLLLVPEFVLLFENNFFVLRFNVNALYGSVTIETEKEPAVCVS